MSVFELVFHKELNMIHCFCGFMGLSHHCTRKIKGTIKIIKYPTTVRSAKRGLTEKNITRPVGLRTMMAIQPMWHVIIS